MVLECGEEDMQSFVREMLKPHAWMKTDQPDYEWLLSMEPGRNKMEAEQLLYLAAVRELFTPMAEVRQSLYSKALFLMSKCI